MGFALSCFVLLLYLWLRSGGEIPLAPKGYRVHVLMPQTKGLGPHSDVRVSGVTIGHVISIEPLRPLRLGRADVLIDLDARYIPLRSDARAMLRSKSIIGEAYVALSLGSAHAPPIPDGGSLALGNAVARWRRTRSSRATTPARVRRSASGCVPRGPALPRTGGAEHGHRLAPALDDRRRPAARDRAAPERLGGVPAARRRRCWPEGLADREQALQLLARSGDRAFNATGRQGRALAAAFRELPGFEREARLTVER